MKKFIPILLAIFSFSLAGCSKAMSAEDAKKFVKENYSSGQVKQASITTITKISKSEGVFALFLPVGEYSSTLEEEISPISELDISNKWEKASFSLDGKKLIINQQGNFKDFIKNLGIEGLSGDNIDGTFSVHIKTDEEGYVVEEKSIGNATYSKQGSSSTMDGSFSIEQSSIVTFK